MKCLRCGHDSKHKDRPNRTCPSCKARFVFEPQDGDPVTDVLFDNAIKAVSADGRVRWGVEHLYYEICRRKRGRKYSLLSMAIAFGLVPVFLWIAVHNAVYFFILPAVGALIFGLVMVYSTFGSPTVFLDRTRFSSLYNRWVDMHGVPKGLIVRPKRDPSARTFGKRGRTVRPPPSSEDKDWDALAARGAASAVQELEPDIGDYSFDRAVICDRARTVDLLIANNFHFENNCAVLSIDGYPEGPYETVKAMLKRNPRLHVFTLHDATPAGCQLANTVAFDRDWFDGKLSVVDLGLRPRHAQPFRGMLRHSTERLSGAADGIDAKEAQWLSQYSLELAAVRPEDVLKRLFRGIQAHDKDDVSSGGVTNCGSFDTSSPSDGKSDDGADSFG